MKNKLPTIHPSIFIPVSANKQKAMVLKVVICIIFIFDLIAFGLTVAAECRRSTRVVTLDHYNERTYCIYNSDISTWYGVGGFLFLLAIILFSFC
jgi:hypothetical protein